MVKPAHFRAFFMKREKPHPLRAQQIRLREHRLIFARALSLRVQSMLTRFFTWVISAAAMSLSLDPKELGGATDMDNAARWAKASKCPNGSANAYG